LKKAAIPGLSNDIKDCIDSIKRGKLELLESQIRLVEINSRLGDSNGTSLLHLAASYPHPSVLNFLLELGADPTVSGDQKEARPYDVSISKDNRDTFRRFMARHPQRWDYEMANIPGPLTEDMERKAKEKDVERKKKVKERKRTEKNDVTSKFLETIEVEQSPQSPSTSSNLPKSLKESIGISKEQRQLLDREKRALAAESRMRSQKNQCGACGKSLSGLESFDKSIYRYCSMNCLKAQQIIF
jgi:hypothetical protein